MDKRKRLFGSFLVCAFLALAPQLMTGPAAAKPVPSSASYEQIDAFLEEQLQALNIPGASLAIIEGDRIVHTQGFGISRPGGAAPTPQTPFFIGSLTKSFTALAIMQLRDAGKIDLDAPVQRYLPWFTLADQDASARITVRHLLNQTSGLTMLTQWKTLVDFDPGPAAAEKQARALATFRLSRPVGSEFEYSNTNYNLLGLVIEAVSGEPYASYVQEHIFEPLQMSHTFTSKAVVQQSGMSSGYISWFGLPIAVPDLPVPSGSLASGQIISSAEDMAHYLIAQLNEGSYQGTQVLSPDGMAAMHSPAARAVSFGIDMGSYGMGWFVQDTPQGVLLWHDGTAPDYFSYMALLPDQKRGMVLLINANEMILNFISLTGVGDGVVSLLAGVEPKPVPSTLVIWSLRALLIIPALQLLDVWITFWTVRRWKKDPALRPASGSQWTFRMVLAMILNLILVLLAVGLLASGYARFMLLFMADLSWLVLICGSFALIWMLIRTTLILRDRHRSQIRSA